MKIFTIAGWSGSGKSALIAGLIQTFQARGRRVIAVKHAPHKHSLQPEAKDTARFLEAGADVAFLLGNGELIRMERISDPADSFARMCREAGPEDVILLEGFRRAGVPLIEVFDPSRHPRPKFALHELAAIVCDCEMAGDLPRFGRDQIGAIAQFMETYNG